MKYLMGVDEGTTGCKAILFDEQGTPLASTSKEYPSYYPHPDNESYLGSTTTESSMMMIARREKGVFTFDTGAVKGRIEFGDECLWIIIDESADERFPVGYHCFEVDLPEEIPPV